MVLVFTLSSFSASGSGCVNHLDCTGAEIDAAEIFIWLPSALNTDESRFGRTGTVNGGVNLDGTTKKLGDFSGDFLDTTNDPIVFGPDVDFDNVINFTVCTWTDFSSTASTEHFITRRQPIASGDWGLSASGVGNFVTAINGPTVSFSSATLAGAHFNLICAVFNYTNGNQNVQLIYNDTVVNDDVTVRVPTSSLSNLVLGDSGAGNDGQGLNARMDTILYYNLSLSSDDISEHFFNNGDGAEPPFAAAAPDLKEFTITSTDLYDGISLSNITLNVSNSTFHFVTRTVNGTIILNNRTIPAFDKFYRFDFQVNDSGGYFNRSFLVNNITDAGSFAGEVFQSVQQVFAFDILADTIINIFTVKTNLSSDTTTSGEILILIKKGTWQLNISAPNFDTVVTNFTISALQNNTLNISMGSIFTFNLIREENNLAFQTNLTNTTELNIFCPNETINIIFNTTGNQNNATRIINCEFTLMQISVDYGILGSYFRTLIPPFSQKNITWYLIDLVQGDTAIQRIIKLLDLTGEFDDAILTVKRTVGGVIRTIIDQRFDIASEVNLFLVKNGLYTISIATEAQEVILGNLIPTEAGTQTITLPKTEFVPDEVTLNGNITWDYTFNTSQNILRMQYLDNTNMTTLVRFTVFNGSQPTQQLFIGESNQNSSVTITFNQAFANNTYLSTLFFAHPGLSNVTEKKAWYETTGAAGALDLRGWSVDEQIDLKKWISWIFLAIWGLLWSRRHIGIGMSTLVIWLWIFKTWQWIDISNVVFGFVVLMAVIGWLVETIKKG